MPEPPLRGNGGDAANDVSVRARHDRVRDQAFRAATSQPQGSVLDLPLAGPPPAFGGLYDVGRDVTITPPPAEATGEGNASEVVAQEKVSESTLTISATTRRDLRLRALNRVEEIVGEIRATTDDPNLLSTADIAEIIVARLRVYVEADSVDEWAAAWEEMRKAFADLLPKEVKQAKRLADALRRLYDLYLREHP